MSEEKELEDMIRDVMEGKDRVEIRPGLSLNRPSKELDVIQVSHGNVNYYLSLCDPRVMREVIDYVIDKKPLKMKKEENEDPLKDNIFIPDDFPGDFEEKKKKKEKDPLDDNPFIPDFD